MELCKHIKQLWCLNVCVCRKLKVWWQRRKLSPRLKEVKGEKGEEANKGAEKVCPWESDYQLLVCEGLFSEYLEMGESGCLIMLKQGDNHRIQYT